jgi:hypothetical protein
MVRGNAILPANTTTPMLLNGRDPPVDAGASLK